MTDFFPTPHSNDSQGNEGRRGHNPIEFDPIDNIQRSVHDAQDAGRNGIYRALDTAFRFGAAAAARGLLPEVSIDFGHGDDGGGGSGDGGWNPNVGPMALRENVFRHISNRLTGGLGGVGDFEQSSGRRHENDYGTPRTGDDYGTPGTGDGYEAEPDVYPGMDQNVDVTDPGSDAGATNFRMPYNRRELGAQFLRDNFALVDLDQDGFLRRQELNVLIRHGLTSRLERNAIRDVRENMDNYKELSNDQAGREAGLSRRDLDRLIDKIQRFGHFRGHPAPLD